MIDIDLEQDGSQWLNNSPEDKMEWMYLIIPTVAKFNKWGGINVRGVYDEVDLYYSNPANIKTVIQEVFSKAIQNNRLA